MAELRRGAHVSHFHPTASQHRPHCTPHHTTPRLRLQNLLRSSLLYPTSPFLLVFWCYITRFHLLTFTHLFSHWSTALFSAHQILPCHLPCVLLWGDEIISLSLQPRHSSHVDTRSVTFPKPFYKTAPKPRTATVCGWILISDWLERCWWIIFENLSQQRRLDRYVIVSVSNHLCRFGAVVQVVKAPGC